MRSFGTSFWDEALSGNRLVALDALRGAAALTVAIFWHYQHFDLHGVPPPFHAPFRHLYNEGGICVEFFFVLSGFIFSHVYGRRIESNGSKELAGYVRNRFARLYPLHLATLLFLACMIGLFGPFVYRENESWRFLLNLGFIQYGYWDTVYSFNGPSWSVSCEILLYAVFFAIVVRFRKSRIWAFLALIALGLGIEAANFRFLFLNSEMARAFVGFPLGCVVYELGSQDGRLAHSLRVRMLIAFGLLCVPFATTRDFHAHFAIPVIFFVFAPTVFVFGHIRKFDRFFDHWIFVHLGNLSYSVYLLHFPIQFVIHVLDVRLGLGLDYSSRTFFLGYLASVVLVSSAVYRWYEKPMDRFIRNRLGRLTMPKGQDADLSIRSEDALVGR